MASLLLIGLGSARVLTRHEVLAAEPAREMVAFGHWIIPTFAGQPRLIKPPGMGWLIAASMELFHSNAEWVARLPSALSGIAVTLMTATLAARLLGRRAGLITGVLTASSHFIILQARLAEADMPMAATVCAAMTLYILAEIDRLEGRQARRGRSTAFFAFVGLSILLKGLVGPMFVFSAVLVDLLVRRSRSALRFVANPLGWLVFFAIGLSWPVAAWLAKPEIIAIWKREMFGRFAGDMNGDAEKPQPWHFYLYNVPFMLLPWFPLAIVGVWDAIRRGWQREPAWKMLAAWLIPGIVILSFSAWKHKHYPIPALPPLTIAAGWGLALLLARVRGVTRPKSSAVTAVIIVILSVIGGVLLMNRGKAPAIRATGYEVIVLGLGIAATILALSRGWARASFACIAATAWGVIVVLHLAILPRVEDQYRDLATLGHAVSADVHEGEPIYLFGTGETHIAYYLPLTTVRLDPPTQQDLAADSAFMERVRGVLASPGVGIAPPDWVERLSSMAKLRVIRLQLPKRSASGVDRGGLVYFRFGPGADVVPSR